MARKPKLQVDLSHIAEPLRHLAVPIQCLALDPANARVHSAENLAAIRGSLRAFGQRKPIVVNRQTGIVEAGNATLQAALAEGWTHIAAVYVDDDPAQAAAFAVADNRTAELGQWDQEALARLLDGLDLSDADLQRMLDDLAAELMPPSDQPAPEKPSGPTRPSAEEVQYLVVIECKNEADQKALLERFEAEGLACKAMMI